MRASAEEAHLSVNTELEDGVEHVVDYLRALFL